MSVFLRIAAVMAFLRAVGLFCLRDVVVGATAGAAASTVLVNGTALANLGFAFLFWRVAAHPGAERSGVFTALLVTGLRAAGATYEVLYLLEGNAAVVSLIDMVACVALFVGMLNALPATLRNEVMPRARPPRDSSDPWPS